MNFENLDPSMKQFEYMLSMQSKWQEQFKQQERDKKKKLNEEQATRNYWGNSSEYWQDWHKNGPRINK